MKVAVTLLAAVSCVAAAQPLVVELPTPRLQAAPRQTVTLMVRLENPGADEVNAVVGLSAPAGWRQLLPPPELTLGPHAVHLLPLTLLLPPDARAGEHELLIAVSTPAGTVSRRAAVSVTAVRRLDALVDQAPSSSLAEPFEVLFRLTNRGNQPERVRLAATSNYQLAVTPEPATVELGPGVSATVRVAVPALSGLERPTQHVLILTASPEGGEPVRVAAATTVVAVAQPARLAYHTFPVQLSLTAGTGTDSPLGLASVEASGRGRLTEGSDTLVSFTASYGQTAEDRRFELALTNPTWAALVGRQRHQMGELLPTARGTGAGLRLTTHGVTAALHGVVAAEGASAGFTVTAPHLRGATLTARGAFGPYLAAMSVHGSFPAAYGGGERLSLELEPAIDLSSGAPAVYIGLNAAATGVELAGALTLKSDGYLGLTTAGADFRVDASAVLLPHVSLEASYAGSAQGEQTMRQGSVGLGDDAGPLRWGVRYSYQKMSRDDAAKSESGVTFAASFTPAPGTYLSGSLVWTSRRGVATAEDLVRFEGGLTAPLVSGTVAVTATTEYDLARGRFATALLGAGWSGPITAASALTLEFGHDLAGSRSTRFRAGVTHDLPEGARVSARLDARSARGAPPQATAELGLTVPLELRLGRRAGVTEVRGALLGADGSGLAGLVVSLAGFTTLTAEDGSFHFPAIPAGEHLLFVAGLPADTVTQPALPLRVRVPSTAPLEITALASATLRGAVHVRVPAQGASGAGVVEGVSGGAANAVTASGLRVVLTGDAGRHEAITNARGEFEVNGLVPGRWRVEVDPASLPAGYELTQAPVQLLVRPGQVAIVEFELAPVRREIRFTGGGALGD